MFSRTRRARRQDVAELNITAFLNLMVALVPFLLITMVFTQLTIKELNLPDTSQTPPPQDSEPKGLTVMIRSTGITLRQDGKTVDNWQKDDSGYDYEALTSRLAGIKQEDPAEDRITLLMEPGISYDTMIQTMDAVHYLPAAGEGVLVDMFPQISVGDAPALENAP